MHVCPWWVLDCFSKLYMTYVRGQVIFIRSATLLQQQQLMVVRSVTVTLLACHYGDPAVAPRDVV